MRRLPVYLVAALAACQPQARRALLIDPTLRDPAVLAATAEPWAAAGYTVEYRRFYPRLTHDDLTRYHAVILLGRGLDDEWTSGLSVGDLSVLTEWLRRGGVVVVGYDADTTAAAERWVWNRWLGWLGTGIAIGATPLEDTVQRAAAFGAAPRVTPVGDSPLRDPGFDQFAGSATDPLAAGRPEAVLARTTRSAFTRAGPTRTGRAQAAVVAAARVWDGLVVVVSRQLLADFGPDDRGSSLPWNDAESPGRARDFLVSLARWTRRPAEWARVPPARVRGHLQLAGGPAPVAGTPAALAPPGQSAVDLLPTPLPRAELAPLPSWIDRRGLRAVWARPLLHPASAEGQNRVLDSMLAFLQVANFSALATVVYPQADPDSARADPGDRDAARALWRDIGDRLEASSVAWIPALDARDFVHTADSAGCVLAPTFWSDALAPAVRALAHLAASHGDLVPAIGLDFTRAPRADPWCDDATATAFQRLVRDAVIDTARAARLAALSRDARRDSLLESGLLGRYYAALEAATAERAAETRAQALRIAPGLEFVLRSDRAPGDWFALGLAQGLAAPDNPVLLWTPTVRTHALLARYRMSGLTALHAVAVLPRRVPAATWPSLRPALFDENAGYFIPSIEGALAGQPPADSLGRMLRRLLKEH